MGRGSPPGAGRPIRDGVPGGDPPRASDVTSSQCSSFRMSWADNRDNSETDVVDPLLCIIIPADGGSAGEGAIEPGSTAIDRVAGLASRLPRAAISRRARVVVVPRVQYPLGHVAVHIVEAESIGDAERTNGHALLAVNSFGPGAIRIGAVIVGQVRRDCLAKPEGGRGPGAARILPLGFAREAISSASSF